jgi:hypothetical protein
MVVLGGVGTATILLIVIVAAIHFRYFRTPADLRPSRFYDAALWTSIAAITMVAFLGIADAIQEAQH